MSTLYHHPYQWDCSSIGLSLTKEDLLKGREKFVLQLQLQGQTVNTIAKDKTLFNLLILRDHGTLHREPKILGKEEVKNNSQDMLTHSIVVFVTTQSETYLYFNVKPSISTIDINSSNNEIFLAAISSNNFTSWILLLLYQS